MADAVKIAVEARDPAKNKGTGTRFARKLRAQGRIPAIIYGHKQDPVPISLTREAVWEMIKKSTHLAELALGETSETVLVRDVQWDHLGKEIIHLDFARVSADDSIRIDVSTLHLGGAVHVRELVLPEGVTLTADPDLLLVHVTSRAAEAGPEAGEGETSVQPVVIK